MKKKVKKEENINTEIQNIIAEIEINNEYLIDIPSESFAQYMVTLLNRQDEEVKYSYFAREDKFVIYKKIAQNRMFSVISLVFIGVILMVGIVILT
ncbi:MAG: hypothetical protein ACRCX2_15070, partial [Paraclostridium sp.]